MSEASPSNELNLPSPIAEVSESAVDSPQLLPANSSPLIFFPSTAPAGHLPVGPQLWATPSPIESRRGSQQTAGYGGLPPPTGLLSNPRRGSATGSYGLPVPPEWMRTHSEARRVSKITHSSLVGLSGGRDSPNAAGEKPRPKAKAPPPQVSHACNFSQ